MTDEIDQKHMPWHNGLPTKPEVDDLLRAFPPESIAPGWEVSDEAVKAIVKARDEVRYRTVYEAWTKRLRRDHNVIVDRVKTWGFRCPLPEEVYSKTHGTLQSAGRMLRKQRNDVVRTKPTNELQKQTQEHQGQLLYAQEREMRKARMNALPSAKAPEMPRISPPTRKSGA